MPIVIVEFKGQKFYKVLGGTPIVGTHGPLFTYTVYIQRGLGLSREAVAKKIDMTLADKRGWIRGGVRFQRVDHGAQTNILVAEPDTVDALCFPLRTEGKVSCCNEHNVVINVERWRTGVPHWPGSVYTYRQMLINHEMGHRIGKSHSYCPGAGKKAPIMQQQTYGLQNCQANAWPLDSELPRY
jgi:hypothetical protein